jgi:hydrogenase-4 component E
LYTLVDTALVLVILTNFMLLSSSRIAACIRAAAMQGVFLGLLPILTHTGPMTYRAALLAAAAIGIKGLAFPFYLSRTLTKIDVQREVEPYVGYSLSIFAGVAGLLLSAWVGSRLPFPGPVASPLAVPVAFSTMLTGFFLIISRRKALTQVIGYLAAENGIFVFGVSAVRSESVMVELAVLLDVLVAVFVMGIAVHHINREFESIDVDRFSKLKG